jgi:serine/threonine-protein kinase HipA
MTAAKAAGLAVPDFHLSENGGLFVMRRFDRAPGGEAVGFEDVCSLQALGTAQKYAGTYERIARSLKDFVSGEFLPAARRQFFATLVLSAMVRNGDAHLKNFAVLYLPGGVVTMAPVFDVVTTTVYLRHDVPALSLAGTKKWWPRKMLERFALSHLSLSVGEISELVTRLADAVMQTRQAIPAYITEHPEFRETGEALMAIWEEGVWGFMTGTSA